MGDVERPSGDDVTTELAAMKAVAEALTPLDGDQRRRVQHWALERFSMDSTAALSAIVKEYVRVVDALKAVIDVCQTCKRTGEVDGKPCPDCGTLRGIVWEKSGG